MKRLPLTFLAAVLAGTMSIAVRAQDAQTPAPTPAEPAPSEPAPSQQAQPVTLSGCVAHAGDAFTLTNAKAASSDSASAQDKVADQYTLVAGSGVDFSPHVGHQVEVTGQATPATGSEAPSFTVSALKMTASSCQ